MRSRQIAYHLESSSLGPFHWYEVPVVEEPEKTIKMKVTESVRTHRHARDWSILYPKDISWRPLNLGLAAQGEKTKECSDREEDTEGNQNEHLPSKRTDRKAPAGHCSACRKVLRPWKKEQRMQHRLGDFRVNHRWKHPDPVKRIMEIAPWK